ncbi:MAG: bifunctional folylpolyglutamate synthase/dihydrofolate synthase [Magnetococcus sp. YQC-9]
METGSPVLTKLLERRPSETIRPGLSAIRRLLRTLGDPQRHLRTIHVAGTNGKGSVIAFLQAILLAAGIPVASFTSPHLHRFNERIRINGTPIADADLDPLLSETLVADPEEQTTFFELTTAAAFLHFSRLAPFRSGAGIVLLETGLGGRLDATNVTMPMLSIITALGIDHADFLGPSLAGIAREKAGILKPGVPAVVDTAGAGTMRVVAGKARRLGVVTRFAGREYRYRTVSEPTVGAGSWRFMDPEGVMYLPAPALQGRHQYANAGLAVAGLRLLRTLGRLAVSDTAIRLGVARAQWPGRLECFPGDPPVWLDGAHNPDAVRALCTFLRSPLSGDAKQPTLLIFSVLNNKDGATMAAELAPLVEAVFLLPIGGSRARSSQELFDLWPESGRVMVCETAGQALEVARAAARGCGRVVVTGSLLLVGEVRSLLC